MHPISFVGRRVPTFAELAQYQVPPREKPIKREAIVFYDSFEGSWLRKAADAMRDKAAEMQAREGIQLMARKKAGEQNISVPQITGDMQRQFQRPLRTLI